MDENELINQISKISMYEVCDYCIICNKTTKHVMCNNECYTKYIENQDYYNNIFLNE